MRRRNLVSERLFADLCILDEDILSINPRQITDIHTLMTIVGGKIVYDAGI
jgi:predicted amidohydrolase YtcJ